MLTRSGASRGAAADRQEAGTGRLVEVPLAPCDGALPEPLALFVEEGLRRSRAVDCFDFVPCEPLALYGLLESLARDGARRYCEWGSGIGIGAALAASQGFEACGIELHPELAAASRSLLAESGFRVEIVTGSYFEISREAEVYFAYCWPGQRMQLEQHFAASAPDSALLVAAHGAADLRCKRKRAASRPAAARPCSPPR